jgi:hypothetical protein
MLPHPSERLQRYRGRLCTRALESDFRTEPEKRGVALSENHLLPRWVMFEAPLQLLKLAACTNQLIEARRQPLVLCPRLFDPPRFQRRPGPPEAPPLPPSTSEPVPRVMDGLTS